MKNDFGFTVEQGEHVTIITNKTDFLLELIYIPIPPKYKLRVVLVVLPNSIKAIDLINQNTCFDLTTVYFRLREVDNERD